MGITLDIRTLLQPLWTDIKKDDTRDNNKTFLILYTLEMLELIGFIYYWGIIFCKLKVSIAQYTF